MGGFQNFTKAKEIYIQLKDYNTKDESIQFAALMAYYRVVVLENIPAQRYFNELYEIYYYHVFEKDSAFVSFHFQQKQYLYEYVDNFKKRIRKLQKTRLRGYHIFWIFSILIAIILFW